MTNKKLTYTAPAIQSYGSVVELTGTFCLPDLGASDTKNLGWPSDTNFKFLPNVTCDQPGDNPPPAVS